jgi:hypothetical protein
LGSKIVSFGQQLCYFFGQQKLFIMVSQIIFWAARLIICPAKFLNGQQLFLFPNFIEKIF